MSKINIKSFIGDKAFYKYVLGLAIPMIIQNFITMFVQMLDNLMVGSVGTAEMSGVSVANQLLFVVNLAIFGMVSGAGIFGAQYAGNNDPKGLRNAFRIKLILGFVLTFAFCWVFAVNSKFFIGLFLTGDGDPQLVADTLYFAKRYIIIMLVGLYPYAFSQAYASTLRETGETKVPMIASFAAVLFNLVFDYVLIFGKFGAPKLGVDGAAIATVGARFLELIILIAWTNKHKTEGLFAFAKKAYKIWKIPKDLLKDVAIKGTPLMLNEFLWASGITRLAQLYSQRGIDVVPAQSISNTYFNLFSVIFISMGGAIGIIIGQKLGAGELDEVMGVSKKLVALSFILSIFTGLIFIGFSFVIPLLYNTTPEIRHLATIFMIIAATGMPGDALCNGTYFTIRSGGKTFITFLMDSGFVWIACVVTATLLIKFTSLNIFFVYFIIQILNYIKGLIGVILVKKKIWINNIIDDKEVTLES